LSENRKKGLAAKKYYRRVNAEHAAESMRQRAESRERRAGGELAVANWHVGKESKRQKPSRRGTKGRSPTHIRHVERSVRNERKAETSGKGRSREQKAEDREQRAEGRAESRWQKPEGR